LKIRTAKIEMATTVKESTLLPSPSAATVRMSRDRFEILWCLISCIEMKMRRAATNTHKR
jgi:hypothetical protein